MKKIFLITFLIIIIPIITLSIFFKEEKKENLVKFYSNKNIRVKKSSGEIINVPFEDYIVGVLAGEMPASFELEALKAQAVASRSYVLKKIEQNKNDDYDITDDIMNQVYLDNQDMKEKWKNNYDEYYQKIKQATDDTRGEYLAYNGEVIEAFFFSTSSGVTENSEEVFSEKLPYLRSVDSSWDMEVSPVFSSNNQYTLKEFYANLSLEYSDYLNIEIESTTSTGRIKKIKINGKTFDSTDIRQKLNLKSTYFTIKQNGNYVQINTKGYGHGVGLSQYGAEGMAKEGYTYIDILKHYYKDVEILKIEV